MSEPSPTQLRRTPALIPSYLRAVLPIGGGSDSPSAPSEQLALPEVRIDPRHVARYRAVCGWPSGTEIPLTYPHVLAFPLTMALLTRRDFPVKPLGLVHLANRIERYTIASRDEPLTLGVWAEAPQPHAAGTTVDIHVRAEASGAVTWHGVSTYLRRAPRSQRTRDPFDPPAPTASDITADWQLSARTGRAYAAVSGDRNPIHLHALTARPFGFRNAIAHGMWAKARCLAELEQAQQQPLPAACRVETTFRSPVPLPTSARFCAERAGDGWTFELTGPTTARWHLRGTVTALPPGLPPGAADSTSGQYER